MIFLLLLCLLATTQVCISSSRMVERTFDPNNQNDKKEFEALVSSLPHIPQNIEYSALDIDDSFEQMIVNLKKEYKKGKFINNTEPNQAFLQYIFDNYNTLLYYSEKGEDTHFYNGKRLLRNLFYLKAYAYEYKLLYGKTNDKPISMGKDKVILWLSDPKAFKKTELFMLWNEKQYHLPRGYFPRAVKEQIASNINKLSLEEQAGRITKIKAITMWLSPGYGNVFAKQLEQIRHLAMQKSEPQPTQNK